MTDDWRDVVRDGYDTVSRAYRGDDETPAAYRAWIDELLSALPADGGDVLDLGCGCGVPVARDLAAAGHRVVGVDVSPVQVERAGRLVPRAELVLADLTTLAWPDASFDAVVCLYALIHLPDDEQRALLARIGRWLRPGGTFLGTVGVDAVTGTEPDWLGAGAPMWWNQPDLDTVRGWVRAAGLTIRTERFVPEGEGGHQLLVATATT